MAFSYYETMMEQHYGDGISTARKSKRSGGDLPSARLLSTVVHPDQNHPANVATHALMAWGQLVAHDMGQICTPFLGNKQLVNCCPQTKEQPQQCLPIGIPNNDHYFSNLKMNCMDFQRVSTISYDCKLGSTRRNTNQQTSYLDGSVIYGSSEKDTHDLRQHEGGLLQSQHTGKGELLPASLDVKSDQCSSGMGNYTCFRSGDGRVNSQPSIVAMHTTVHLWHNVVARILAKDYPDRTDEVLFQEARRIVGAAMQIITFCEFLPLVLGQSWISDHGLDICDEGRTKYDPEVNPTTTTEFSTGAFRLGHSLPQNNYRQVNLDHDMPILDNYFYPMFLHQGHLDNFLMGLYDIPSQDFDRFFSSAISDHLYQVRHGKYGLDLVAYGIQRGRDMGLPPYVTVVEFCTNKSITSFEDLVKNRLITNETVGILMSVYEDVEDIDFYTGGFIEIREQSNYLLAPTFSCVVAKQFQRMVKGDRFFFKHDGLASSFTQGQLKELMKVKMSNVFCDVGKMPNVLKNVFRRAGENNPVTNCGNLTGPDFQRWLDK